MDEALLKQQYRIGEVSSLFGIGQDSLRYYERLGIVVPKRQANGYRAYGLDDMFTLSLIKDLRMLGFSMQQIKTYLDDRTLESTGQLLSEESVLIDRQIKRLQERKAAIERHLRTIDTARTAVTGRLLIERRPERRCIELAVRIEADEEMDVAIQRLRHRIKDVTPQLSDITIGANLSRKDLEAGATNIYDSVFFVLKSESAACDYRLPEGNYLVYRYRGSYEQNGDVLRSMLDYAQQQGLDVGASAFEIYELDNRDTADPDEYLTRIEIPLSS